MNENEKLSESFARHFGAEAQPSPVVPTEHPFSREAIHEAVVRHAKVERFVDAVMRPTAAPRADEGAERSKPHLLHGVFDSDGLTRFRLECPYEVKGVLPAGRRCWSLDDDGEIDSLQCFAKGWVDECGAELISFEITDPSFPIEVDVELHGLLQTPNLTLHVRSASSGDGGAPTPATRIEWPGEVVPGGLEAMSDDMGGVGRETFERQMRLVDQTILYDPTQPDRMGNCWQACIASVLGVPLEEVPHFVQMYESMAEVEEETRRWLQGRGYEMVEVGTTWLTDSRAVVILHGRSPRDVAHVVVGRGIEVVHDPHPSRAGLRSIQGGFLVMPVAAPAAPSPVPEEGPPTETPFDYLRRAVSLFLEGELEEEELGFALVESGLRSAATPEQGKGPAK